MSILSQYGVPSRPSFREIIATVTVLPADDVDCAEPRAARERGTHVTVFLASIALLSLGIIGLAWYVSSPTSSEVAADVPRVPITIDQRAAAQPPVASGGSTSAPKGSSVSGGSGGVTDPAQLFYFFGATGPVPFQRSVSAPGATPMFTSLTVVGFGSASGPDPAPGQSGTGTTGGSTSTPGGGSTGGGPVGGGPTPTTEPTSAPSATSDPTPPATTDPTPPNDPPPSSDPPPPPPPPTTDPTSPPPTTDPTPPTDPPPSSDPTPPSDSPPSHDPPPSRDPGGPPGE